MVTVAQRAILDELLKKREEILKKRQEIGELNGITVTLYNHKTGERLIINKSSEYYSKGNMEFIKNYIKDCLKIQSMNNEIELNRYATLIGEKLNLT